MTKPKTIYLDYAATTPIDPAVIKAMQPYWAKEFANPSALYKSGQRAAAAIAKARADIGTILNCAPKEITFTAGGTESNNVAIFGVAKAYQTKYHKPGHIITTAIEHHSVLHTVQALQNWGWQIDYAPVDKQGLVNLDALKKLVRKDTALISVMYANNEIGTIEPIAEIGKWLAGLNKMRAQKKMPQILFHTDACQAGGALSLDVHQLKVDLLTLNGSKVYGPKQIGLLYVRQGIKIEPLIYGGGQESNLRSGTENVPAIVGLSSALVLAQKNLAKENKRLTELRNYLYDRLSKKVKGVSLNGPILNEPKTHSKQPGLPKRLANNLNISFDKVEGETLMLYLDGQGIEVATGSACATTSADPSHVLEAIGVPRKKAYNAIRITLGKSTTKSELNRVLEVLPDLVSQIRRTVSQN